MLVGINIRNVGPTAAQSLARSLGSIDRIESASAEEITAVDGVGAIIAESLAEFFAIDANRRIIEKLRVAGVSLAGPPPAEPVDTGGVSLAGLTFVLTGTLDSLTRDEAQAAIEMEALARAVVKRLLHEPTERVRNLDDEHRHARLKLLRELFGLEEDATSEAGEAAEVRRLAG